MRNLNIANPFAAPVFHEETVSSTMDVSRALAARGLPHGTVIAADFQTAGRGRGGQRSWDMDRGNLAFTVLLRFTDAQAIPAALTLRAGLAVSLAIEDFIPALSGRVRVKWPNDIMVSRVPYAGENAAAKKAVGILTEADGGNAHIGIGINIAENEFPAHLQNKATSLGLASDKSDLAPERFTLLEKILARLYPALEENSDWHSRLQERLYQKGEYVTFIEGPADSGTAIQGILSGIGESGELLITPRGADTPLAFFAGELRVY